MKTVTANLRRILPIIVYGVNILTSRSFGKEIVLSHEMSNPIAVRHSISMHNPYRNRIMPTIGRDKKYLPEIQTAAEVEFSFSDIRADSASEKSDKVKSKGSSFGAFAKGIVKGMVQVVVKLAKSGSKKGLRQVKLSYFNIDVKPLLKPGNIAAREERFSIVKENAGKIAFRTINLSQNSPITNDLPLTFERFENCNDILGNLVHADCHGAIPDACYSSSKARGDNNHGKEEAMLSILAVSESRHTKIKVQLGYLYGTTHRTKIESKDPMAYLAVLAPETRQNRGHYNLVEMMKLFSVTSDEGNLYQMVGCLYAYAPR